MEQHPIPQQISSYEFRLVGNMTLKQFFKLASGLIVALIFYSIHLPFLIKWPLVVSSAGLGAALAFVPFNERPLEVWVTSFLKSIFSPTIFLWRKQNLGLDILDTIVSAPPKEEETLVSKEPQLNEYLASLTQQKPLVSIPKAGDVKNEKKDRESSPPTQEKTTSPEPWIEISLPKSAPPKSTVEAEFGEIPMPKPPLTPNIAVGMIVDDKGKIIENAIIEIQDDKGNPIRALRTNSLGQFKTSAPMANGDYLVLTEKEGFQFDILRLKAEGKVILPIKIKAKP